MKKAIARGFTLIELLVVIAITAVLLGIIVTPMVQGFNFTREAEGLANEQERGRILVEQIARDINSGTAVADNQGVTGATDIVLPGSDNLPHDILLYNSRIDIFKPALSGSPVNGGFVNQNNGHIDPTLHAPNGQPVFPAVQGATAVRYFIGLRRPLQADGLTPATYNNPYDGLLMATNAQADNLYVLYRAEFQPYIIQNGTLVYNSNLFKQDPKHAGQPYMADPFFFTQSPNDPNLDTPQKQAQRIQNWLSISSIVTESTRYDMILPIYNKATRQVTYDAVLPRIVSLIQFKPSPMGAEPPNGMPVTQFGNEASVTSNATSPNNGIAPDVLRTTKGEWANAVTTVIPFNASVPYTSNDYCVLDTRPIAGALQNVLAFNPQTNGLLPQDLPVFDLNQYATSVLAADGFAHYPVSEAVAAAQLEDGANDWLKLPPQYRDEVIPFNYNTHAGSIFTSFNITEVGNPNTAPQNKLRDNAPVAQTCGGQGAPGQPAFTPFNDPNVGVAGSHFYDATFDSINERFNKVYNDYPALRPNLKRFLDLRVTPEQDGWASPMDPAPDGTIRLPWDTNWTGFNTVTIVPGSEVVEGPDQRPGPGYGQLIRYTRVNTDPGPNQYRINYTNQPEPLDYSALGVPNPTLESYDAASQQWLPNTGYNATDITKAIIQPRFKVGYVEFDSDPNVPLPGSPDATSPFIHISYRFQFNRPADSIAVDYDTREQMNVLLTVRSYPQSTLPNPQTITLQASAPVKNFLR